MGVLSSFFIKNTGFLIGLGNVMWPLKSEVEDLGSQLKQGGVIFQEELQLKQGEVVFQEELQ